MGLEPGEVPGQMGRRSVLSSAHRYSIVKFWASIQPNSRNPWRKASTKLWVLGFNGVGHLSDAQQRGRGSRGTSVTSMSSPNPGSLDV